MSRFTIAIRALVWMGQSLVWGAQQAQLRWSELGPRIADRQVALVMLPGGTHIKGKVRQVDPEGLRLRVSKTSDRSAVPKGERLIPRGSISLLHVTEHRKLGRLLVTPGALAAAAGIVAANRPEIYGGPLVIIVPAVIAGGMVGVGIGGYYTGKALDKRVTEIRIIRDDQDRR